MAQQRTRPQLFEEIMMAAKGGKGSSSRSNTNARNEIIALLKEDHQRAKKAFRQFEKLDPEQDAEACQELVQQTCSELEVHADLEEELFYPAAREALPEEDLVEEAEVEHMTVKVLIEQLKSMTAADEKFAATFKVLGEYVKHHIKEEETEMFESLGRSSVDWGALQQEMMSRREDLMVEKGLASGEAEESQSDDADGVAATSSGANASSRSKSQRETATARPQASAEDDAE